MTSPIVVAILVFASIYAMFVLVRVFADMFIVGIALASAVIAYNIQGFYPDIRVFFRDRHILDFLTSIGLGLPEQPTTFGIFVVAICVVLCALVACLPFLPFSATYRQILGIEKLSTSEEAKIRSWIVEEIEREQDKRK